MLENMATEIRVGVIWNDRNRITYNELCRKCRK